MTQSLREIKLPAELCHQAEQRYAAHFSSFEELMIFVLRSLVDDRAMEMDEAEARMIEQRLRELGYLEPAG